MFFFLFSHSIEFCAMIEKWKRTANTLRMREWFVYVIVDDHGSSKKKKNNHSHQIENNLLQSFAFVCCEKQKGILHGQ